MKKQSQCKSEFHFIFRFRAECTKVTCQVETLSAQAMAWASSDSSLGGRGQKLVKIANRQYYKTADMG